MMMTMLSMIVLLGHLLDYRRHPYHQIDRRPTRHQYHHHHHHRHCHCHQVYKPVEVPHDLCDLEVVMVMVMVMAIMIHHYLLLLVLMVVVEMVMEMEIIML
jgi:hypothetical protein